MPRIKTNTQIEVVIFKKSPGKTTADDAAHAVLYLLLHRVPARGGFWQPLTGGLEEGEQHLDTLRREVREETGITEILNIYDPGYGFDYDADGKQIHEYVYGAEVSPADVITLSDEHDAFRWITKEAAIKMLKFETNKIGLEKVAEQIT